MAGQLDREPRDDFGGLPPGEDGDAELIALARKRLRRGLEADKENREKGMADVRFARLGEQWSAAALRERGVDTAEERPTITTNLLEPMIAEIVNDQREARPAIHVIPVDSDADPDVAAKLQGLVRAIEADSYADIAYDTAHEHTVDSGFGYIRVVTVIEPGGTKGRRRKCIKILPVEDRLSVVLDPNTTMPDFSDARWAFVSTWMDLGEYRATYPAASPAPWESMDGEDKPHWYEDDRIRVCEYFYLEERGEDEPPRCCWRLLNGYEVLEATEFPSQYIPVVKIVGANVLVDGRRHNYGIVRHARGPAQRYNYMTSAETEVIGMVPKAPALVTPRMLEGHTEQWDKANRKAFPYLYVNPDPLMIGAFPQRLAWGADTGAIQGGAQTARDDVERVTGQYAANKGAASNEQSGKAILQRQKRGDVATFHFSDNMARAMRHLGRIIVDMIPTVYGDNPERIVRIMGDDGKPGDLVCFRKNPGGEAVVEVEAVGPLTKGMKPQGWWRKLDRDLAAGERITLKAYDASVGRYDVRTQAGPSYATKRQENLEMMMEMLGSTGSNGPLGTLIAYLISENIDAEGKEKFRDGLLAILGSQAPEAAEAIGGGEEDGQPDLKSQIRDSNMQVQQLTQQLQVLPQLQQAIQQLTQQLQDRSMERQTKLEVAAMQREFQLHEADQATLRTAIQEGAETHRHGREAMGMAPGEQLGAGAAPGQANTNPPPPETAPSAGGAPPQQAEPDPGLGNQR